ncbi:MAG: hypothetical protein JWR01_2644 [Subtercola sp.]|nr:hypothetical protein [Subtercola sp.]
MTDAADVADAAHAAEPDASAVLLQALAAHLGTPLAPRLVTLPDGVRVEIDGWTTCGSRCTWSAPVAWLRAFGESGGWPDSRRLAHCRDMPPE